MAEFDYDSKKYVGATAEGCKMIHLALSEGKRLTIDGSGRIHDDTGRWIADGKERENNV
ncbi:MAG: hypothetical protein NC299_17340 [Lachnospiraceae bacterium]|nr:hypothetical protein [Ruminococcus sp.]MCM1277096.1 hypothetical protein [Lachnospiraceae bacterium]